MTLHRPCFFANYVEPIFLLQSYTQPDHHTEESMQLLLDMRLANITLRPFVFTSSLSSTI